MIKPHYQNQVTYFQTASVFLMMFNIRSEDATTFNKPITIMLQQEILIFRRRQHQQHGYEPRVKNRTTPKTFISSLHTLYRFNKYYRYHLLQLLHIFFCYVVTKLVLIW